MFYLIVASTNKILHLHYHAIRPMGMDNIKPELFVLAVVLQTYSDLD